MTESFTLAQRSGNMGPRATYTAPNGDKTIMEFPDRPYFSSNSSGGHVWAISGTKDSISLVKDREKWYIYFAGSPETISRVPPPPADESPESRSAFKRDRRMDIRGTYVHAYQDPPGYDLDERPSRFPTRYDFAISPLLGAKLDAYIHEQALGPNRDASNSSRVQKEVEFRSPDFEPRPYNEVKRGVSEVAVSKNLPSGLGKSIASFLVPKTKKGGKRRAKRRSTRRRKNKV